MLSAIAAFSSMALKGQLDQDPVLWVRPDGKVAVEGKVVSPTFSPGVRRIPAQTGWGYDFDGKRSGILLPDLKPLALTKSMTVAVWLRPRSYVNDGPGAQVLFRGDDRCALDPYTLVIHANGNVVFGIQNEAEQGNCVGAELPLNKWTHVTASLDALTGKISMWLNGELAGFSYTTKKPIQNLDGAWAPGIGIGNVQNEKGPHNQPFNGTLFDLRLYSAVVNPPDAGFRPNGVIDPPVIAQQQGQIGAGS